MHADAQQPKFAAKAGDAVTVLHYVEYTWGLADNECFSPHIQALLNSPYICCSSCRHCQSPSTGTWRRNKGPNSYTIGSIWDWDLRMCPHNSKPKGKSQQEAGLTWWQQAQLRAPHWWHYIALGSASLKPYCVPWSQGKQVKVLFFHISHLFDLFVLNSEIIPWLTLLALQLISIWFFSSSI